MAVGSVYFAPDCDRTLLNDKRVAVIGYGSQGKAFALNLRDSGCNVSVVLRSGSKSLELAKSDGLMTVTPTETADFDIIVLAIPDHEQIGFYSEFLLGSSDRRRMIVLLHGLNYHFANIKFSESEDVVLVAPHGPGADLRRLYLDGSGMSCFLAVGQDNSGRAHELALAIADAIGSSRAGVHETTFANETLGDLFGEQALLVGGLAGLTDAIIQTMLSAGLPAESVRLETVSQLKLLAAMIEEHGPAGMIERVSKTAGLGSLRAIPRLFDETFMAHLTQLYKDIESGDFNRDLLADAINHFAKYQEALSDFRQRPSQRIGTKNN